MKNVEILCSNTSCIELGLGDDLSYGNSSAAHGHPVVLALVCCTVEHTMTEESCLHGKHHVFAANSAGGRLPSADAPWPAIAEVSDVDVCRKDFRRVTLD